MAVKTGSCDEETTDKVKVFLRIRPLTATERERGEEQVRQCNYYNYQTLLDVFVCTVNVLLSL